MAYEDRSCRWSDIVNNAFTPTRNNFRIRRHALQILQPVDAQGNLQCRRQDGRNSFPRLDYPKGFPDWWHLSHTEVTVPSEHFQAGKQYDAEVHLAHFYSVAFERKMGKVAIFLESDATRERWPFLDKLICQWREIEEQTRQECGLPSVPAYPGCRNPSRQASSPGSTPTVSPATSRPVATPTATGGSPGAVLPTTSRPALTPTATASGLGSTPTVLPTTAKPVAPVAPTWQLLPGPWTPRASPETNVSSTFRPDGGWTCKDLKNSGFDTKRICKDRGGCCNPTRAESSRCHFLYELFGNNMGRLCSECCKKQLGPARQPHPTYPPIQCSSVKHPGRICKRNSCCEPEKSTTPHCKNAYETYGNSMGSVCWYCCKEPKDIHATTRNNNVRKLGEIETSMSINATLSSNNSENVATLDTASVDSHTDIMTPQGLYTGDINMDPSNFEVNENVEEEYLASLEEYERMSKEGSRHLSVQGDNYASVPYSPYQWMREVKTEYYFRYDGAQMVPPCFETVHYRVMKDPIRIHPIQLAELERLLAWRISPKGSGIKECQNDTAGRPRPGSNGTAVDLNRPLQQYTNIHRKVFCECGDWISKFQDDKDWCLFEKNKRWFEHPYNYESGGKY